MYILLYFCLALIAWFSSKNQQSTLNEVAIRFTTNIREKLFQKYLFSDIAFFDNKENEPGNLTFRI